MNIMINAEPKVVTDDSLSYDEVVVAATGNPLNGYPWNVKYSRAGGGVFNKLAPGERTVLTEGMTFIVGNVGVA